MAQGSNTVSGSTDILNARSTLACTATNFDLVRGKAPAMTYKLQHKIVLMTMVQFGSVVLVVVAVPIEPAVVAVRELLRL